VTYADGTPVRELTLLQHVSGGWKLYVTLTGETLCEGSRLPNQEVVEASCKAYSRRHHPA
jgi:hypothetical protein